MRRPFFFSPRRRSPIYSFNVVSGDVRFRRLFQIQYIFQAVKSRVRNREYCSVRANGKGRRTRAVVEDLYEDLIVRQGYRAVTVSSLFDNLRATDTHGRRASSH